MSLNFRYCIFLFLNREAKEVAHLIATEGIKKGENTHLPQRVSSGAKVAVLKYRRWTEDEQAIRHRRAEEENGREYGEGIELLFTVGRRGLNCCLQLDADIVGLVATMDSFKGQGGIQMLLTAEQEAQHIVSSARNLKMARLKQAKEEAEKDVALFRSQMETEYQNKISESSGSSDNTVKRLEEETDKKIKALTKSTSMVSKEIIEMLMKHVTSVKI
ncbi:hypothetical protein J1N35_014188 [Gossypium stocksii]|uniref:V-type proton ATPase subunit G n=1 Tax=Gossypium stocksii TaxID=47602 RepID=A0A9D4A9P2_9ROSI|nr:hypothetical protein J1N35_014188 [Gossypium stocksii]